MQDIMTFFHAQMLDGGPMAMGLLMSLSHLITSIPVAIGCYFVADKLGRNKWAWVILSLIPVKT